MFLLIIFLSLSQENRVAAVTAKPTRPNILYILADDLGWADVSWNNPGMKTPNLERLAGKGVILDQFYTQPKCSPSRAALLTGLFPYKTSMQRGSIGSFRPTGLPTVLPSLPELLRLEGYSTHLVGKWHLGYCSLDYTPLSRGFNTFFGCLSQQANHYTRKHQVNRHIGAGYDLWRGANVSRDGEGEYSTFLWEEEVERLLESLNTSSPWYIQLSLTAAHTPYQVPDRFSALYSEEEGEEAEYSQEAVRRGMVTAIDESVGRLVKALKLSPHHDNTLVIFTSDNGSGQYSGNYPLRGKKGEVLEGGVRVPAFVSGKPLRPHLDRNLGPVRTSMVHIVDWFPTILSLAGHQLASETDGLDIWGTLTGDEELRTSFVYNIDIDDQSDTFQLAVRRRQFKLVWGQIKEFKPNKKGEPQVLLFDLSEDPEEKYNLADSEPTTLTLMKQYAISLTKDMKMAFHPNGLSLGYPRYHKGFIEPGWCHTGWWEILWKDRKHLQFLEDLQQLV